MKQIKKEFLAKPASIFSTLSVRINLAGRVVKVPDLLFRFSVELEWFKFRPKEFKIRFCESQIIDIRNEQP